MDEREQLGLLIAATARITRKGDAWMIPSSIGDGGKYAVRLRKDGPTCSCPDHETRGGRCKHIIAAEYASKRDAGEEVVATNFDVMETINKPRPTYAQKSWKAYNAAQTSEKERFLPLLHELCRDLPEPLAAKTGRPRLPISDAIFSVCFKVYSTVSGRRFMSDMRDAQTKGFVKRCPHYNSIFNYLENPALTPILKQLVVKSSLPLKAVEVDFAVDSSGFSSSRFNRWFDEKYGKVRQWRHWVKVHLMCGVKTNIVTSIELTEKDGGDAPYLSPMAHETAKNFHLREVSADKGYSSVENHEVIEALGASPLIPFRSVTTGWSESKDDVWRRSFHYFSLHREEFLSRYHKRSNVESTFSMVKAKFGDAVRSKTDVAMRNEILCKVLCHNICRLIHAMHELGITTSF